MTLPIPYLKLAINPFTTRAELLPLFCGESQTEPNHTMGPTWIDYYLIHTVLSGKGSFHMRGQKYELYAGDSFVICPKEMYCYEADAFNPWHYCWIAFQGHGAEQLLSSVNISAHRPVVHHPGNRRIITLYRKMYQTLQQSAALCDMEVTGYMKLLFAEYGRANQVTAPPVQTETQSDIERQIQQAVRYLTFQFAESISIEQVAQSLGYNRIYLSKMFKQFTGMTPMQYLTKIRMERAKTLLSSGLTIEQISKSVGYKDPLYFSKQYKKWHGSTPSDHRAELSSKAKNDCLI